MHSLRAWIVRFAGVTLLTVLTLWVFFNFVGKIDVGWALPWTKPFRHPWPDLPPFAVWKTTAPNGGTETIYQVPTRQLTRAEVAQLTYTPTAGATNAATASPSAR